MSDEDFISEIYQLVVGDEHASRTDNNKFSHEEILDLIKDYQLTYYEKENS